MVEHNEDENRKNDGVSSEEFKMLVGRGREGDSEAVGTLLSKYRNYLLLIANQDLDDMLKPKLGASDVVQQSMMLAQQNFDQFRGESEREFLGWLKTILVNDIRDNRRQFSTQKRDAGLEVNMQDHSVVKKNVFDPWLTPSSDAIERERAQLLANALGELSEDHRNVIELRNFQQLDFVEIGQRMDRSADAARKLWARAVETLQSNLAALSPELFEAFADLNNE